MPEGSTRATPTCEALCPDVRGSPAVTPHETGRKVGGTLHWLWVAATPTTTICSHRARSGLRRRGGVAGSQPRRHPHPRRVGGLWAPHASRTRHPSGGRHPQGLRRQTHGTRPRAPADPRLGPPHPRSARPRPDRRTHVASARPSADGPFSAARLKTVSWRGDARIQRVVTARRHRPSPCLVVSPGAPE